MVIGIDGDSDRNGNERYVVEFKLSNELSGVEIAKVERVL
jgi:chemotaxis signal transduction protein